MKRKNNDFKIALSRVSKTIIYLMLFVLGTKIVPPLYNLSAIAEIDKNLLSELSSYTGSSIGTFSLFTLGVTPVLISSMIMQLLAMGASPSLKKALKSGKITTEKFENLTKLCFIVISLMSSFVIIYSYNQQYQILLNQSFKGYIVATLVMAAGAWACNFIANQITTTGITNGVSLIILTSIANSALQNITLMKFDVYSLVITLLLLFIVCLIVATSVNYPLTFIMNAGHCDTEYTIQLHCAGIMPIIISQMIIAFIPGSYQIIIMSVLIAIFTCIYTVSTINPSETSKTLRRVNANLANLDKEADMEALLKTESRWLIIINLIILYVLLFLPVVLQNVLELNLLLPCITLLVLCSIAASVVASFDVYMPNKKVNKILNF